MKKINKLLALFIIPLVLFHSCFMSAKRTCQSLNEWSEGESQIGACIFSLNLYNDCVEDRELGEVTSVNCDSYWAVCLAAVEQTRECNSKSTILPDGLD